MRGIFIAHVRLFGIMLACVADIRATDIKMHIMGYNYRLIMADAR